jgi:hypothetical protein
VNELFIDIWFTDDIDPEDLRTFSGSLSLMLQLAQGLNRTDIWQECTKIRLVQLLEQSASHPIEEDVKAYHRDRLDGLISESRINATVEMLTMTSEHQLRSCSIANSLRPASQIEDREDNDVERMTRLNSFIKGHTENSAVLFLNLPRVHHDSKKAADQDNVKAVDGEEFRTTRGSKDAKQYVEELSCLTEGLPPTVLTAAGRHQTLMTTEI